MDRQQAQARLNEVQALYREWLALLPQLEAAQTEWQRAAALIAQLDDFYAHEYLPLCDAVAGGLALDERTEGEYRVLSEDAIFDALGDANRLAWGWMRLAMAALDPARDASAPHVGMACPCDNDIAVHAKFCTRRAAEDSTLLYGEAAQHRTGLCVDCYKMPPPPCHGHPP